MSDLAIGVFAASAASGTTVGFVGAPAALATGVVAAVPIGAAIGLVATVAAEMLSNRLEESLNRAEFEENLRQTVDATENALETGMIAILHEHVEAWYADISSIRLASNKARQTTFRQ
jgi:CRISPR/Cas system CMR subunit Cmr4 (Cas7 group RAMP superfamily)